MENKKNTGRKKERGLRLSGHLTVPASRELERLREEYGTRSYEILSTAMVFYGKMLRGESTMIPTSAYVGTPKPRQAPRETPTTQSLGVLKAVWCEEAGGKIEGNVCFFDKYEVTLAGTTDVMKRSVALKEMPDNRDEFMNFILGGYANVYEARRAAGQEIT